jgi:two-component system heavy metal sensor histidine kinase CusS
VTLELQLPAGLRLHGDERLLMRVVENLVTNSLRYVPEGGRIRVEAAVQGESDARLVVSDTGPGIPEEARRLVFERHARLGEAVSLRHRGLGLYYCQAAIEAHGGRIHVEGSAGDCRMVIVLPSSARQDR